MLYLKNWICVQQKRASTVLFFRNAMQKKCAHASFYLFFISIIMYLVEVLLLFNRIHITYIYIRNEWQEETRLFGCLAISLCKLTEPYLLQLQNRHGLFVYVDVQNGRKVLIITIFSSHISLALAPAQIL